jgi:uncharacterized membrane protein
METRPQIRLTLSPLDKKLELISKFLLVFMWVMTLYALLKLPTTIPTHFNASGQADDYGNKLTLLILPIIASIVYFGLTIYNCHKNVAIFKIINSCYFFFAYSFYLLHNNWCDKWIGFLVFAVYIWTFINPNSTHHKSVI